MHYLHPPLPPSQIDASRAKGRRKVPFSAQKGGFRDLRSSRPEENHLPDSQSEGKKINLNLVGKKKISNQLPF